MIGRKRDVILRVEIFGGDLDHEWQAQKLVDGRHNVATTWNSQASILEVVSFS